MKDFKKKTVFEPNEFQDHLSSLHRSYIGKVPSIDDDAFETLLRNVGIGGYGLDLRRQKEYLKYKITDFEEMKMDDKVEKELEELKNSNALYGPIFTSFVMSLRRICKEKGINVVHKEDKCFDITKEIVGIMKPDLYFGLSLPKIEKEYPVAPLVFAEYGTEDTSDLGEDEYDKHKDYHKMLFFLRVSIRVMLNIIKCRAREEEFWKLKVFGILIGIQNGWILEISCPNARLKKEELVDAGEFHLEKELNLVDPGEFHLTIYNICLKSGNDEVNDLIKSLLYLRKEIEELIQFFSDIRTRGVVRDNCTVATSSGKNENSAGSCYISYQDSQELPSSREKRLFLCTLKRGGNQQGTLTEVEENLLKTPNKRYFLKKFNVKKSLGGKLLKKEYDALQKLKKCKGVVKMVYCDFRKHDELLYEELSPLLLKNVDMFNAKEYLIGMVNSLLECHGEDVYHCDVKLDNFMLDSSSKVKVIDFDISTISENQNEEGYLLTEFENLFKITEFSRGYRPPEMNYHQKSDVYCLGIVFLEIVSRKRIREYYGFETPMLELKQFVRKNTKASDKFLDLVDGMTNSSVNDRYGLKDVKTLLVNIPSIFTVDDNESLVRKKRKREDDDDSGEDPKRRRVD